MKKIRMCVLWFLCPLTALAEPGKEKLPDELAGKTISLNPEYWVYQDEELKKGKKFPLLIYLHGGGGTGNNIEKIRRQPMRFLETIGKAGEKCLCVAPQALHSPRQRGEKGGWVPSDLDVLIGHLKKTLPIDEKRVYLTGNSMGGYGTYVWAGNSPQHFAAIAPMVGGIGPGGPKDITKDLEMWGRNLATIPMKSYYGGQDKVVPADRGAMVLKAINTAGGKKCEVIVLEEEGHGAGRVPFGDVKFVEWLFSQKKGDKAFLQKRDL